MSDEKVAHHEGVLAACQKCATACIVCAGEVPCPDCEDAHNCCLDCADVCNLCVALLSYVLRPAGRVPSAARSTTTSVARRVPRPARNVPTPARRSPHDGRAQQS